MGFDVIKTIFFLASYAMFEWPKNCNVISYNGRSFVFVASAWRNYVLLRYTSIHSSHWIGMKEAIFFLLLNKYITLRLRETPFVSRFRRIKRCTFEKESNVWIYFNLQLSIGMELRIKVPKWKSFWVRNCRFTRNNDKV